jgi:hypothetical protein
MENLESAVAAVVGGEITHLPTVLAADHPDLLKVAASLPPLSVSRSALTRVLQEWRSGHCTADDVQQWASFVRRGYVSGKAKYPIRPIEIEYDARDEKLIAEIIGRFDEVGDIVDGYVGDEEQAEMLKTLGA